MMEKKDREIVAVLLTHNRKDLLIKGLHGLFDQTKKIKKIFIIDSVSTDGTHELLLEKGIIDRSDIKYIRLKENKGPSGGFTEGIRHALNEDSNWIWVLDDDVYPKNFRC